jgi:spermidine/putrescine transport system permease protein
VSATRTPPRPAWSRRRAAAGRRRDRPFRADPPLWLALPALTYHALLFLLPLGIVVALSLGRPVGYSGVAFGWHPENYADALQGLYLDVFGRTLAFAAGGTLVVLAVGFPVAYWMARHAGRWRTLVLVALIVPFWTSFLVRTFAFLILLAPEWTLVQAIRESGLAPGFDPLRDSTGTFIGIVYNYLPLAMLPLYAALERMDWAQVDAARDLGAGPWGAFRQVTLPAVAPGVLTACLLVFVPMTGEYIVPQLLGSGTTPLMANLIGNQFLQAQNWPFGAALAMVLIATVSALALLALLGAQRWEARRHG